MERVICQLADHSPPARPTAPVLALHHDLRERAQAHRACSPLCCQSCAFHRSAAGHRSSTSRCAMPRHSRTFSCSLRQLVLFINPVDAGRNIWGRVRAVLHIGWLPLDDLLRHWPLGVRIGLPARRISDRLHPVRCPAALQRARLPAWQAGHLRPQSPLMLCCCLPTVSHSHRKRLQRRRKAKEHSTVAAGWMLP